MTLRELLMFLCGAGVGTSWGEFFGNQLGGIAGGVAGFVLGAGLGVLAAPVVYGVLLLALGVVYSPAVALGNVFHRCFRR